MAIKNYYGEALKVLKDKPFTEQDKYLWDQRQKIVDANEEKDDIDFRPFFAYLSQIMLQNENVQNLSDVRMTQLEACDFIITTNDPEFTIEINNSIIINTILRAIRAYSFNNQFNGQCLIGISKGTHSNLELSNNILYSNDIVLKNNWGGINAKLYNDMEFRRNVETPSQYVLYDESATRDIYIYCYDKKIFTGGLYYQMSSGSLSKFEDLRLLRDLNNKMRGLATAKYNPNQMRQVIAQEQSDIQSQADTQIKMRDITRKIAEYISDLNKSGYAVLPDNVLLEVSNMVSASAGSSYLATIQHTNDNEKIALLGQSGTTELTTTGSYAALKEMRSVTIEKLWRDIDTAKYLQNAWLQIIAALNGFSDKEVKINYIQDENQDMLNAANVYDVMFNLGLTNSRTGQPLGILAADLKTYFNWSFLEDVNDDDVYTVSSNNQQPLNNLNISRENILPENNEY